MRLWATVGPLLPSIYYPTIIYCESELGIYFLNFLLGFWFRLLGPGEAGAMCTADPRILRVIGAYRAWWIQPALTFVADVAVRIDGEPDVTFPASIYAELLLCWHTMRPL